MKLSVHPTIILNPASGQGDPEQRVRQVRQAAKSLGWKGKLVQTTPDKLATYAANIEYGQGQRDFIICGGDGTVIEAIEALINKDVAMGIVPLGTGNLLAKNLGLPLNLPEAMAVALLGEPKSIDIGQANDSYFAIMAGMGLDAYIMRDTSRSLKNILGLSAYYVTGFKKMWHRPIRFQIQVDEAVQQFQAKTVLVANMGKFGGKLEAVPNTSADDGRLKVGVIKARNFRQLLDVAKALLQGNINLSRYYVLLEGRQILIKTLGQAQPYQCDGNDFSPVSALKLTIHPQAIKIRVPKL